MSIIQVEHLSKYFESKAGRATALEDISFEIEEGEFVGIIGKSGSGKSTLINMLAGIDRPSSGDVRVYGKSLNAMTEEELAFLRGSQVGIVFQFFQLLPVLTVKENILLPMDFLGCIPETERMDRANAVLRLAGISAYADQLPSELSGGQQQKAALARALANDPPILIADEPTGNLDTAAASDVFKLFEHLAEQKKTVVMVTHDSELVQQADRVIVIKDGKILRQKTNGQQHKNGNEDAPAI